MHEGLNKDLLRTYQETKHCALQHYFKPREQHFHASATKRQEWQWADGKAPRDTR